MAASVFVSYSHRDSRWVRERLVPRLRLWGLVVSIDYESFDPGTHLVDAIHEGIRRSRHVIFVVTKAFAKSEWSRRELQQTISDDPAILRKKAVPVILDRRSVPRELQSVVWCTLHRSGPRESEWRRLCRTLGGRWASA